MELNKEFCLKCACFKPQGNEKINYQLVLEKVTEYLRKDCARPRLLLHACCAPCSSYVLEYLSSFYDITVFFSNPNITDKEEYDKRLFELRRLVKEAPFCSGVNVVDDGFDNNLFFNTVTGLEKEREGGARCKECFKLRLKRTADYGKENGFSLFATTLTVSPHKNAALINEIGFNIAESCGISYLPSDFKKRDGYKRSIILSEEYGLYRQNFCGCEFSRQSENKCETENNE